ncbi:PAS domain-containing protein [Sorangium sp. So ce1182]|uniref:PAS domain-containing protein n=1 Tax=Sorangium sp. So ce1182 TaxID=3133334 RepID=UPI003F5EB21F
MSTSTQGNEALEAEIARLRARVAELERSLEEARAQRAPEPRLEGVSYQAIFDALPVPLTIYRPDGTIIALNDVNCARFGTTRELIASKYNVLADEQAVAKGYAGAFQKALAGEEVKMQPTFYETAPSPIHPGPSRRVWSQATYAPIRDEDGVRLVASVSVDVTAQLETEAKLRQSAALLEAVIENAPLLIYVKDREGRHKIVNRKLEAFVGKPRDEIVGKTLDDVVPTPVADVLRSMDTDAVASAAPVSTEVHIPTADGGRVYLGTTFALRDEEGRVVGTGGIGLEITERVRAEEQTRKLQEDMLRIQDETLRALSTPLLPIARGVLVMPLVGEVSRERAAQVIETLLDGISRQQARIAILDVTGVPQAGPSVTDALLRTAQSVRLLGAEVVLTGIRPSVAQALVELGTDLGGIVTRGTLEQGVAYALSERWGASRSRGGGRRQRGS